MKFKRLINIILNIGSLFRYFNKGYVNVASDCGREFHSVASTGVDEEKIKNPSYVDGLSNIYFAIKSISAMEMQRFYALSCCLLFGRGFKLAV